MSWSFRKRVKVSPWVSLNISKSGVSTSVGSKGAKVTVGPKGTYVNVGVPETGIYSRTKIGNNTSANKIQPNTNKRSNVEPSIPGCIIALVFIVGSFILAFTVCDNFSDCLLTVIGLSAFGMFIFGLMTIFSEKKPIQKSTINTEGQQSDTNASKIQYHPEQIGDDEVRYALVQEGKRTLFVVGLNPSTATSDTPDPTMQSVLRIAEYNGYDGFIMINLYPKRATQPYNLPKEFDKELHESNLQTIQKLLEGRNEINVWLAYGANANRRDYLIPCFEDIVKVFAPYNPKWFYINTLTKEGFPPHPLYQKVDYFKEYPMK